MTEWREMRVGDCLAPVASETASKVQTRDYKIAGRYPIVDQGKGLVAGWTDNAASVIRELGPVVVFGDHTRALKYVDFPFARGADGTQILKPVAGIGPRFFYFALRALGIPSRGYNRHFQLLRDSVIRVPHEDEQAQVATVLSCIELAIAVQEQQVHAAGELKRATMRALFTRGLHGEAQKVTEIGQVPESWDVVALGTVREWLQYGTSVRCGLEPNGNPVLRIPNIESGRVNATDLKYGIQTADEVARYRLEVGDLLFIRTNGVVERLGTCAVFEGSPVDSLFASYLIRARLDRERADPRFVAHFFGSETGTAIVAGRATPAADGKYNLNTGTIDGLPIPLPPSLDEQREIANILDALDRKLDLHRRKRVVLDELFKSLLHKLMTGEIRVADLDLDALAAATPGAGAAA